MTEQPRPEPVTDLSAVTEALESDPELATQVSDVLNHLGSFVFDPTGQDVE